MREQRCSTVGLFVLLATTMVAIDEDRLCVVKNTHHNGGNGRRNTPVAGEMGGIGIKMGVVCGVIDVGWHDRDHNGNNVAKYSGKRAVGLVSTAKDRYVRPSSGIRVERDRNAPPPPQ